MKTRNFPGFTAQIALATKEQATHGIRSTKMQLGTIRPAMINTGTGGSAPDVDCNTFPDNISCKECGGGGIDCCQFAGKGPGQCKVRPYNPLPLPVVRGSRFPFGSRVFNFR